MGRGRALRSEWIYVPYWIGDLRCVRRDEELVVRLAVGAIDGEVRRLDRGVRLATGATEGLPDGDALPLALDESEARLHAEERLPFLFLARRGRSIRRGPFESLELVGWPHLVQHFALGGRPTFRAYDALTAERVGSRRHAAIVAGFLALARRSPRPPATST